MTFDDHLRQLIREEIRAAFREATPQPSAPSSQGEMLSTTQAAALCGLGLTTIRGWLSDGTLTPYGSPRSRRVEKAELLQAMRRLAMKDRGAPSDSEVEAKADSILRRVK